MKIANGSEFHMLIFVLVTFPQTSRLDGQELQNDSFCSPAGTFGQCIKDTEIYLDVGINLKYQDDTYCQG